MTLVFALSYFACVVSLLALVGSVTYLLHYRKTEKRLRDSNGR